MSLTRIFLQEKQKNYFRLSYNVPYSKMPYLISRLEKNVSDFSSQERGNTIYGYLDGSDEALFKYDTDRQVMNSDLTYSDLIQYKGNSGE